MKDIYIKDLKFDQEFDGYFVAKDIDIKTGSNGKKFLSVTCGDKTGDVSCKKWGIVDEEIEGLKKIKAGSLIKIRGQVKEYKKTKQVDIKRIRLAQKEDKLDKTDFFKAAPEEPEYMWQYIYESASAIEDEQLKEMCIRILEENKEKLLYYPAASRNHHAQLGGLLWHTKRMLMNGISICSIYTNLKLDWVKTGVIIHDIEKLNEILSDENGIASDYSFEGKLLGHIVMGINKIEKMADEIGMSNEKKIMLEHMILSHHYEPDFGSPKRPMFPEAEILHYLDIIDARMFDMQEAVLCVEPGQFSEKVFVLDNRQIYKPTF